MVLELTASRLIARHLGSSLYTWTAVIGIVLSGITIGNYLGGRIADRFKSNKALSMIFLLSSVSCVLTIILNNTISEWLFLWYFSWPVRVFSHVAIIFIIPSILLGMISPVAAKMALAKGLPQGRTVGDIYAYSAAGSIAGTFAAGYYLIALMGTAAIVWSVAAVMFAMSILYWPKSRLGYAYAVLFVIYAILGTAPWEWAQAAGASMKLRAPDNPGAVYEDETQYCYVAVLQSDSNPNRRFFMQDKLKHSEILMDSFDDMQDFYPNIFAAITHAVKSSDEKIDVLHIGGGGYVFPRYVHKHWPASTSVVVEIDPGITKAAMEAFGLEKDTAINIVQMDARNYVDRLIQDERLGKPIPRFDFVYEDAFNDYSVPFQLITKEFNDKIYHILKDDGIYMANLIDIYNSGRFVGSYIHTLEQTFDYVYVTSMAAGLDARKTFIITASKIPLEPEEMIKNYEKRINFWQLNDEQIETLKSRGRYILLTDNYAPVENMLGPVVRKSSIDMLLGKLEETAINYENNNQLYEAVEMYERMARIDVTSASTVYTRIGSLLMRMDRYSQAIQAFESAIEYNEKAHMKQRESVLLYHLGLAYKRGGQKQQADIHINKAIEEFKKELIDYPDSASLRYHLGDALGEMGRYAEAQDYFSQAIELQPYKAEYHIRLAQSLLLQQQYEQALTGLREAVDMLGQAGETKSQTQVRSFLRSVESQIPTHPPEPARQF